MIPSIRQAFNQRFNREDYQAFMQYIEQTFGEAPTFKVAETPVFVPQDLYHKLASACENINDFLTKPNLKERTAAAFTLPQHMVPNEDDHPLFLQYDFAISRSPEGELRPHLIEMQGFPSLYFYQHLLALTYQRFFRIPYQLNHLFSNLNLLSYVSTLRSVIIGDHDPKHVVLLDIEPRRQNTRIDFWGTEQLLGIKVLCLSDVKRHGKELFYLDKQGRPVAIHRIFNRVIFDELIQYPDPKREFNLTEEVEVEWAGHPNWFMRISKHTMPMLEGDYIPPSYFLDKLDGYPEDLNNYVLKPLYSFSGKGVKMNPTREDLDAVEDRSNFILQRKIEYSPVIESPYGGSPSKCELRMMMLWLPEWDRPRLTNNLVRLTRGEMMGVRYNMDESWVGASIGFFDQEGHFSG